MRFKVERTRLVFEECIVHARSKKEAVERAKNESFRYDRGDWPWDDVDYYHEGPDGDCVKREELRDESTA